MASSSRHDADKVFCKVHPNVAVVEDCRTGDQICSDCGSLVGDRINDVGAEWQTFRNDKNVVEPSRLGAPENQLLSGTGMSAVIEPGPGAASLDTFGTSEYHNKRTMSNSDKTLINAFREITVMADRISLPKTIVERANKLFKEVHDGKNLKGRANDAIASACLYIACRQEGVPRTLKEICAVSKISKKEIGRCFKLILKALETSVDIITTGDFMSRFCSNLGLPTMVQKGATYIAKKSNEMDIVPGRSPISVAAAAIYLASQNHIKHSNAVIFSQSLGACCKIQTEGINRSLVLTSHFLQKPHNSGLSASEDKRSQKEIGDIAGVADVTIRQSYKLMYPHATKLFPEDFKFATPIEQLPQM